MSTTTRVRVVTPAGAPAAARPPRSPTPPAPLAAACGKVQGLLHFAVRCVHPKGEDTVTLARRAWPSGAGTPDRPRHNFDGEAHPLADSHYAVFGVFDGHNGRAAAAFAEAHVADAVHAALPPGPPPRGALDGRCGCVACAKTDDDAADDDDPADDTACAWRAGVARALAAAVAATHAAWAATSTPGGTTATLVLAAGRLVTVANVGDSAAFIDTGGGPLLRLTADHRVASSRSEAARVRAAGGIVAAVCAATGGGPSTARDGAGLGPLRAWTADGRGGFANARALGDLDAASSATAVTSPAPALTQVLLPREGGRVLIASDGVWDAVPPRRAARAARPLCPPEAAEAVVGAVLRAAGPGGVPRDDATIVVVDVLPSGTAPSFPEAVGRRIRRSASRGAALAALAAAASASVSADAEPPACAPPLLPGPTAAAPKPRRGLAALFKPRPKTPPAAVPTLDPPGGSGVSLRGGSGVSLRGSSGASLMSGGARTPDASVRSGGSGRGGFFAELARSVRGGNAFAPDVRSARPTLLARVDLVALLPGDAGASTAAACGYSSDDESGADDDDSATAAAARAAAALAADGVLTALLRRAVHDAPAHFAHGVSGGLGGATPAQLVADAVAAAAAADVKEVVTV